MATRMREDDDLYRAVLTVEWEDGRDGTPHTDTVVIGPYVAKAPVKAGIRTAMKDYNWRANGYGRHNQTKTATIKSLRWEKMNGWHSIDE